MSSRCRTSRFTLLELVIAVSITLMLSLALYSYSHSVTDSWGQMLDKRNVFHELLNLDRAADHALAQTVAFTWKDRDDEDRSHPFFVGEPDYLRLAYLHQLKDEEEGAIRFAEFLVDDEENLLMRYTDRPFWNWDDVPQERRYEICLAEKIQEIRFFYVDWNDQEDDDWETRMLMLEEWETEESERMDVPLAIGMTVTWKDGKSFCWFRRTMGNGYRERFGRWEPLNEDKRQ